MKKLLFGALVLAMIAAGCAVTDYPVITDTRGDFSGVIRTGHKAYTQPTSSVATIYADGSDELFTMVYQNQYGDQKLYTFNNFDPTGSVNFLDQTYCDWRYDGCEIARAWNPANAAVDSQFDYEFFPDCSGARSLSLLVSDSSRIGECGDAAFNASKQALAGEFANLATTSWRGGTAYVIPMDSSNTNVTLTSVAGATQNLPLYGSFNAFINDKMQLMVPMTPNMRHELQFLSNWSTQNGKRTTISVTYGSLSGSYNLALATDGLNYNLNRF
jgi:hypothetical protein